MGSVQRWGAEHCDTRHAVLIRRLIETDPLLVGLPRDRGRRTGNCGAKLDAACRRSRTVGLDAPTEYPVARSTRVTVIDRLVGVLKIQPSGMPALVRAADATVAISLIAPAPVLSTAPPPFEKLVALPRANRTLMALL
jgi:hypothetical protein